MNIYINCTDAINLDLSLILVQKSDLTQTLVKFEDTGMILVDNTY